MEAQNLVRVGGAVGFIEDHLGERLALDAVAAAVHCSKYHLHRLFTKTAGLPLHGYVVRRRLTEAARLLVFTRRPVAEIALMCGYESQQAFTSVFGAMYKAPPAAYRARRAFYPLQHRLALRQPALARRVSPAAIQPAGEGDIPAWMELVRSVVGGYPGLDEAAYLRALRDALREGRALAVRDGGGLAGAMVFSHATGCIDFLGVHPQYRDRGIQRAFLDKLLEELLPGRTLSVTTFRAGDRADRGDRRELEALGFTAGELLVEYGYPTQRFTHPPKGGGREGAVP